MINEAKEGLEYVLRHNDTMRRTQEREEDLQCQEGYWREKELIRKAQEESEKLKKQAKIGAYRNKEQQDPEDQQAAKAAMEHAK